jgi:hypothetical protein
MELVILDGEIWVTAFMILLFMMFWEQILAVVLDKGIYMLMAFLGAMEMEMYMIWDCDVQTLSRIAATRLQKELTEWQVNPPCGFEHKVTESLQRYAFLQATHCYVTPECLTQGDSLLVKVAVLHSLS